MIDTLKRFWKQNWHKVASVFSTLVFVSTLAYTFAVNAKAYSTSPPNYIPFVLNSVDSSGVVSSSAIDPNNYIDIDQFDDRYNYTVFGIVNSPYLTDVEIPTDQMGAGTLRSAVAFPIEIDFGNIQFLTRELTLTFNVLDVYPFVESGYRNQISYHEDVIVYGSSYLSPLKHLYFGLYTDDVDYEAPIIPCTLFYSYIENGSVWHGTLETSIRLDDAVSAASFNVYDEFDLSVLPSSAWITRLDLSLSDVISDYLSYNPDATYAVFEVVQRPLDPSQVELSERFLSSVLSPTVIPDVPSDYQNGYIAGRNSALTDNLGIVDWLTEAGDAVMNFQLFRVGRTPITIGSIFTVIMGSLLIIFILKVFAGG